MSVRRLDPVQPESFEFTAENRAWADALIAKYPEGKQASAVIPLLWRAQEQVGGWLPEPAIRYVAETLNMAQIRVLEVATFYTMFNLSPVGKFYIQLCGTTPCLLRGSDDLKEVCKDFIGAEKELSEDGLFSWLEVECLGACCNAPMVQINKYYFEDLTAESFKSLLTDLKQGNDIKIGTQINRTNSCPADGKTSLIDVSHATDVPNEQRTISAAELAQWHHHTVPSTNSEPPYTNIDNANDNEQTPAPTKLSLVGGDVEQDRSSVAKSADNEDQSSEFSTASNLEAGSERDTPSAETPIDKKRTDEDTQTGDRPEGLSAARNGKADDLRLISGVGPKLEKTLNSLGVFHFSQIAEWTEQNIVWIDDYLSFKGRVEREDWIGQARILAEGGQTDFSKRQDTKQDEEDA